MQKFRVFRWQAARLLALASALAMGGCGGGGGGNPPVAGQIEMSASVTALVAPYDQPQTVQVIVNNAGSVDISGLSAKVSDPMMLLASDSCAGHVLAAKASCTLTYLVKPASAGQGTLSLALQFSPGGGQTASSLRIPYNFGPSQWVSAPVWTSPWGNPSNTGYVPVVLDSGNFKLAWEYALVPSDLRLLEVTSDQSRIYFRAFAEPVLAPHQQANFVYALSQRDGVLSWKNSLPDSDWSGRGPAVIGGMVFAAVPQDIATATYVWIDAVTGVTLESGLGYNCRRYSLPVGPVVWDQSMYFVCGGIYRVDRGPSSSKGIWDSQAVYQASSGLAVDAQSVYAYDSFSHQLLVLDRATGKHAFQIKNDPDRSFAGAPVLDEGSAHVFMGGYGVVSAMDLTQRSIMWTVYGYTGQPAYGNQTVYAKSMDEKTLNALDAKTGALLWSWGVQEAIVSNIIVTKTHVFLATASTSYGLNISKKSMDWAYPAGARQLLLTNTGQLIIADMKDGVRAIALH